MRLSCYVPSQIIPKSRVVHLAHKQILKRHILSYPKVIVSKNPHPGWGRGVGGGGGSIPGPWTIYAKHKTVNNSITYCICFKTHSSTLRFKAAITSCFVVSSQVMEFKSSSVTDVSFNILLTDLECQSAHVCVCV